MKWRNHRFVTGAIVFSMSGHLLPTAIAMYGAVFPDAIEGDDYTNLYMYQLNHRRTSHLLSIYVVLLACLQLYYGKLIYFLNQSEITTMIHISLERKDPRPAFLLAGYCATWFLIGCVFHLIEDFFCGGIPIFESDKRYGLQLFYVNTPRENVIALVLILVFIGFRYFYIEPFCYGL